MRSDTCRPGYQRKRAGVTPALAAAPVTRASEHGITKGVRLIVSEKMCRFL